MNARFLTEREASQRTQISLATLRRWRLENRGPKFYKFGSLVRYDEEELNCWEQAQPSGGRQWANQSKRSRAEQYPATKVGMMERGRFVEQHRQRV